MTEPYGVVYVIKNNVSEKRFFGVAPHRNLRKRILGHILLLENDLHPNTHLQRSFNLYGVRAFKFEAVKEALTRRRLEEICEELIDEFDTTNGDFGYNHRYVLREDDIKL